MTAVGATAAQLGIGVLGASSMVHRAVVADAVRAVPGVHLAHEATRTGQPSGPDVVRTSTDYEAVLEDPAVDVVYIPLPNHLHEGWVLACAAAGKHVLCEKPLAIDATSAARMAEACAAAGVLLLEAYMSPFHPRSAAVQEAATDGTIGTVLHGEARMSGMLPADNHRWSVRNGGGALLDVGIYCLEPFLSAIGWTGEPPTRVAATSRSAGDGVDASTTALLTFPGGQVLTMHLDLAGPDQQRLQLTGTAGAIEVDVRHATPDRRDDTYRLREPDGSTREVRTGTGSCYEGMIAHVRDVVRGDAAPLRDARRSVALARVLDAIAAAALHPRAGAASDAPSAAPSRRP